jgi:hypothetical protein
MRDKPIFSLERIIRTTTARVQFGKKKMVVIRKGLGAKELIKVTIILILTDSEISAVGTRYQATASKD